MCCTREISKILKGELGKFIPNFPHNHVITITYLYLILSFQLPELDPASLGGYVETINSTIPTPSLYQDENVPEHRLTGSNSIELTDRGRYQVRIKSFSF